MPEIRFEFQLGSKGQGNETSPVLDGVHALVKDHNYCVALPDKPIDFAVSEKGALTVNLEDLQAKTIFEPILEQMKSSIRGQSRLRAPSTLDIPIPRPWVTPAHVSQMPTYDAAPLKITHLKARYRFVGVEHRQAIPFVVDGQQATFTTVESGKLGPRYLELSVVEADTQPLKKSEEAQVRKAKLRSAFQTGLKLVELVDRAAKGKLGFKEAKRLESSAEDAGSVASSGEHELISTATSDGTPVEEHVEQQRSAASG